MKQETKNLFVVYLSKMEKYTAKKRSLYKEYPCRPNKEDYLSGLRICQRVRKRLKEAGVSIPSSVRLP